jgi:hypothetical protein
MCIYIKWQLIILTLFVLANTSKVTMNIDYQENSFSITGNMDIFFSSYLLQYHNHEKITKRGRQYLLITHVLIPNLDLFVCQNLDNSNK